MKNRPIILVEDDADDQELLLTAFENLDVPNEVKVFESGEDVLNFLKNTTKQPFIIISDVNMPGMNGLELRKQIYADEYLRTKSIPFIFLTTSAAKKEIDEAYEMSIQGFFVKERSFEGVQEQMKKIFEYWKTCKHPNAA